MSYCGPIALAAILKRPVTEIEARVRTDRERYGKAGRGLGRIRMTYTYELMRVLISYGYAVSSECPVNRGSLAGWAKRHRASRSRWFIRVGGHFLARNTDGTFVGFDGRRCRVTEAYEVKKIRRSK